MHPLLPMRVLYRATDRFFTAHVDLTWRCNFRCVHCAVVPPPCSPEPELSTVEVREVLRSLYRLDVLRLLLSGGEVWLRRDLPEILEEARRLHFAVQVKTNAALLTPQRVSLLLSQGVRDVDVTIFSLDPAVNDAITRHPGSLAKVLKHARQARQAGLRVSIKMPTLRANAASVADSARALLDQGFQVSVASWIVGNQAERSGLWELNVPPAEAMVLQRTLRGMKAEVDRSPSQWTGDRCGAGRSAFHVAPNGDVRPCVFMREVIGNLRRTPLEELVRSPAMRAFGSRERADVEGCGGCLLLPHCSFCPAAAEGLTGNPWKRTPFLCRDTATHCRLAGGHRVGREYVFAPAAPAPGEER